LNFYLKRIYFLTYSKLSVFHPGDFQFKMSISDNLRKVKEKIAEAALKAGRNPEDIFIVAVTKGRTPQEIREVIDAGIDQ